MVVKALGGKVIAPPDNGRLKWNMDHLLYAVLAPFLSKITGTSPVFGTITHQQPMAITSHMSDNGVIFSDEIEFDYLKFNASDTVTIGLSLRKVHMLVKQ